MPRNECTALSMPVMRIFFIFSFADQPCSRTWPSDGLSFSFRIADGIKERFHIGGIRNAGHGSWNTPPCRGQRSERGGAPGHVRAPGWRSRLRANGRSHRDPGSVDPGESPAGSLSRGLATSAGALQTSRATGDVKNPAPPLQALDQTAIFADHAPATNGVCHDRTR